MTFHNDEGNGHVPIAPYHFDFPTVRIDEVIGTTGVRKRDLNGIVDYDGRHAVTGQPGDVIIVKDGKGAENVKSFVHDYLNDIDIGVSHVISLPPSHHGDQFETNIHRCLHSTNNLQRVAEEIEASTADKIGFVTFNYSDEAAQLARKLDEHVEPAIHYLGTTTERSSKYNDKAQFKDFVRDEAGITSVLTDRRIPDDALTPQHLRTAFDAVNNEGEAMVKANRGASGINTFVITRDTIADAVEEMQDTSSDITTWIVEPYHHGVSSASILFRTLHGPCRISRVSRQLFVADDGAGTEHLGNVYPSGLEGDIEDDILAKTEMIMTAQANDDVHVPTSGIDFIITEINGEKQAVPVENNLRLTGHDPLAALHSILSQRHDEALHMLSYNLIKPEPSDFTTFRNALEDADVLYQGDEPYGTIPTNVGPLHRGKATVVSFATSAEQARDAVERTSKALDSPKSLESVKTQTTWWPT